MRNLYRIIVCLGIGVSLVGCQTMMTPTRSSVPFEYQLVHDQLVFHSDFPLPEEHRIYDELIATRAHLSETLKFSPSSEPIHVYLFGDQADYYDFLQLRFPEFSNRRAIFVETDVSLSVYAHWGDHFAEDLRHEVVHGYLHAAIPGLPLWLDEGLAEYFEVPRNLNGINKEHLKFLLAQKDLQFDLARLEQLHAAEAMTHADYAESWAWVHFLLNGRGEWQNILIDYISDLRSGVEVESLNQRLEKELATPQLTAIEHLQSLR